jgi:hypothetical protein
LSALALSALLLPLQIIRSALWVLFALPVIRMTRGPAWQIAVLVGLLFALPMNIGHFIPNPIMPDPSVRLSHFIETTSSNFIYRPDRYLAAQLAPQCRGGQVGQAGKTMASLAKASAVISLIHWT